MKSEITEINENNIIKICKYIDYARMLMTNNNILIQTGDYANVLENIPENSFVYLRYVQFKCGNIES